MSSRQTGRAVIVRRPINPGKEDAVLRTDPPSAAPFQFGSTSIADLDGGRIKPDMSESLAIAWDALQRANHHVRWYFASTLDDEKIANSAEHLLDTMLCHGRLLVGTEPLVPGDLVCGGGRRYFDGDWGVVVNGAGPKPAQVIVPDEYKEKLVLANRFPRRTAAWRPIAAPVIDVTSPVGRFWGPGLFRFRRAISAPSISVPSDVDILAIALGGMRLPVNPREFAAWVGPELRPSADGVPPGSILVHPGDGRVGIGVGAGLCQAIDPDEVQWRVLTPAKARLPRVWIPHV
jgi:hypothetical protein